MALISPEEADHTSALNNKLSLQANALFEELQAAVKDRYMKGQVLSISPESIYDHNYKDQIVSLIQKLAGDKWVVKFNSFQTGINEYEEVLEIRAADEIKPRQTSNQWGR